MNERDRLLRLAFAPTTPGHVRRECMKRAWELTFGKPR